MAARPQIAAAVSRALSSMGIEVDAASVHLERPARRDHGDWSTNAALVNAKALRRPPRQLAEELAEHLRADPPPHLKSVEVAGPGFVNLHLSPGWLYDTLTEVVGEGETDYARNEIGAGEKVQIEFISANPTGPLHVGNGWWGAYGDAMGRVMTRCGWQVHREYYVNDTGGQIRVLGESLLARRRGEAVPEAGYQGEYVAELAVEYDGPEEVEVAGRWAAERILENIRTTLARLGIIFDEWYSQASVEESGAVRETIDLLASKGLVEEEDGAVWFRSSRLGDNRDRVLVKSNGDATYLAGDLAYHRDKFLVREFDRVIDIFGADHAGQVKSLTLGVEAMGVEPGRLEVKIGQMVSLVQAEGAGRMSKRAGNVVSLDELDRRHRGRCDPSAVADVVARPGGAARPRPGSKPVDGEPRLLRAVRACPHRVDRARAHRARHRAAPSRGRRPGLARPRPGARAAARSRGASRRGRRGGYGTGLPTRSPRGSGAWPARSTASTTTARCWPRR